MSPLRLRFGTASSRGGAALLALMLVACGEQTAPAPQAEIIGSPDFNPDHFEIAQAFAPVFFQSTGDVADYLTRFTYDGDWQGSNNWDNLYYYPLRGYVYWALEETEDYYFIFYLTFHPRDWCGYPGPFPWPFSELWPLNKIQCLPPETEHENDLEGVVLVVDKLDTGPSFPYGRVVLAETRFHTLIRAYANTTNRCSNNTFGQLATSSLSERRRYLEGVCLGWTDLHEGIPRPSFYIQHQGHGVLSTTDPDALAVPPERFPGVIYVPGDIGGFVPSQWEIQSVYGLTWIDWPELGADPNRGLWRRRLCSSEVYGDVGTGVPALPYGIPWGGSFSAQNQNSGATAPWRWRDETCIPGTGICFGPIDERLWFTHYGWWASQSFSTLVLDLYRSNNIFDHWYYVSNIFLDESTNFGSCAGPQFSMVSAAVTVPAAGDVAPAQYARARWEGERLSAWTGDRQAVSGLQIAARAVRDTVWGDRRGDLQVLTLEGAAPTLGPVTIDLDAGSFEVIMRAREPADPRDLWLAWRETDASAAAELVKMEPRVVEPDGWVVASARVSAGTGGPRRVELSILFSGHDKGALDVAFVTVVQ